MYNGGSYKNDGIYNGRAYKSKTVYKESNGGGGGNVVNIGGVDYEYIQVGNLYIIKENLRLHTSNFYYPNNDPSKEMSMGLLYQAKIMFDEIEPILSDGWRIPDVTDFDYLYNFDRISNDYISTIDGGNDSLGTSIPLCGYRGGTSNFVYYGSKCLLWSSTAYGDNVTTYNADFTKNANMNPRDYSRGTRYGLENTSLSVRVVKDV